MATETEASKIIGVLSHRTEFIECLLDEPKNKQEFVEELDVSRSTANRAIRELEAVGFIEYQDIGYRLTLCGGLAVQEYQAFEDSIETCITQTSNMTTISEAVGIITQRIGFAECLLDKPMDKQELVEELGVSRSTVDRSTRNLELLGLIEYQDGELAVTERGEEAIQEYQRLEDLFGNHSEMNAFLQWMPDSEFGLDLAQLVDADIVLPEPGDPWTMVNRHVKALRQMNTGQITLPLTGLYAMEALHERLTQTDARCEVIVVPVVADAFQSNPDYAELHEEMVDTGRFEVHVHDGDIPYYLGILDDTVQMGVNEDGEPRGLLETDSEEVREWAENRYESYKQEAEPLSQSISA